MKKLNCTSKDDFLYQRIIKLLEEVKLVRGGTDLAYTLRNHKKIRDYCREKQSIQIQQIELDYFNPDGSLDEEAIEGEFEKISSQKLNHVVY